MKRLSTLTLIATVALGVAGGSVQANHTPADSTRVIDQLLFVQTEAMTDGEVRKIDKDTKKITIKHGEIKNLGMPPMTMVFQVKDPALLEQVKQGDKVRFRAEESGGAIVVVRLERVS